LEVIERIKMEKESEMKVSTTEMELIISKQEAKQD
jgi:hypothetical protein